ncbi:MAG: flavodoxin family protein [Bacillota bacterium]
MKIGLIVHSQTGHTLGIAREIYNILKEEGHAIELEMVVAKSQKPWKETLPSLSEIPDPKGYDILILGAPVWGFTLSLVMSEYLYQVQPLDCDKLILFSTGALHRWLGGNRAIKKMTSLSKMPHSKIVNAGSVRFPRNKKPRYIDQVIENVLNAVKTHQTSNH